MIYLAVPTAMAGRDDGRHDRRPAGAASAARQRRRILQQIERVSARAAQRWLRGPPARRPVPHGSRGVPLGGRRRGGPSPVTPLRQCGHDDGRQLFRLCRCGRCRLRRDGRSGRHPPPRSRCHG